MSGLRCSIDWLLTAVMLDASWLMMGLSLSISGRLGSFHGWVAGGPSSGAWMAVSWACLGASAGSVGTVCVDMDLLGGGVSLPLAGVVKACGIFRGSASGEVDESGAMSVLVASGEARGSRSASAPGTTASSEAEGPRAASVPGASSEAPSSRPTPIPVSSGEAKGSGVVAVLGSSAPQYVSSCVLSN